MVDDRQLIAKKEMKEGPGFDRAIEETSTVPENTSHFAEPRLPEATSLSSAPNPAEPVQGPVDVSPEEWMAMAQEARRKAKIYEGMNSGQQEESYGTGD